MEHLCAQLSSLEDSASKVLAQPNKCLALVVRFNLFPTIRPKNKIAIYSSRPGCPQTVSPSPSLLWSPRSQWISLIWGGRGECFAPLLQSQGEGCWREIGAVSHSCRLRFCIYQLGWYRRSTKGGEWPSSKAGHCFWQMLVTGISSLSLCYSGAVRVWPAVHEGVIF